MIRKLKAKACCADQGKMAKCCATAMTMLWVGLLFGFDT
jgi:hypothetical protein